MVTLSGDGGSQLRAEELIYGSVTSVTCTSSLEVLFFSVIL